MPPLPSITDASTSHGAALFRNRNCPFIPVSGSAGRAGTHNFTSSMATAPHTATIPNVARHVTAPLM